MSTWVAFLRGINLGRRRIAMADLKAAFEAMGFDSVRTLLASGNVRFSSQEAEGLAKRIEAGLGARFGFEIGVVLRTEAEIAAMLASAPFAAVDPAADVKRYVILFDRPLPPDLALSGAPGDFDVKRIDPREIYLVGHPSPKGRYGEGIDQLGRELNTQAGKGRLETMRNWNTIEKLAG